MRLVKQFFRTSPSGFVQAGLQGALPLGGDGATGFAPTGVPGTQDNLLSQKNLSNQGWPAHRIAVAYKGPTGAPTISGQVWVYDHLTNGWYEVGAPAAMVPNRITYFDVPAIVDVPPTSQNGGLLTPPGQGNIEAVVVVQPAGSMPTGAYTFAMGADLTTLP